MNKKILILAAHPDDAEICMGGTILNWSKKGYEIKLIVFSVPETKQRIKEAYLSAEFMGIKLEIMSQYNQVNELSQSLLVQFVDDLIMKYNPSVVFTHWEFDTHDDHRKLFQAVQSSSRLGNFSIISFGPPNIYSSNFLDFHPNYFINIDLPKKIETIKFHKTQTIGKDYLEETARITAGLYGKHMGMNYAEGFIIIRHIDY